MAGLSVVVGAVLANDYGLSTDELDMVDYANHSLGAYLGLPYEPIDPIILSYYGPAFSSLFEVLATAIAWLFPFWNSYASRHFLYFVTFLIGALALYDMARRLGNRFGAASASLLFLTQPLLFGHAFINPKDIPFMSAFLATMAVGLRGFDRIDEGPYEESRSTANEGAMEPRGLIARLRERWSMAERGKRILAAASICLLVVGMIELYWSRFLLGYVLGLVEAAYQGTGPEFANRVFQTLAAQSDRVPLGSYLSKTEELYSVPRRLGTVVLLLQAGMTAGAFIGWEKIRRKLAPFATLLGAGILLGLTTSIRVAGPFAGILLSAYCLMACKRKMKALLTFWSIAGLITYLTWPALWSEPIGHFLASVRVMTDFRHDSIELYDGMLIASDQLPWHFVPKLVLLQLTEPVFALALAGSAAILREFGRMDRSLRGLWIIILVWFAGPVGAQIVNQSTIYNNFRVLLFAIPPIFIFGAAGSELLGSYIGRQGFRLAALALILAPGLIAIVRLHPYEYVYYNSVAGGTARASQLYETDYWCTSVREAMVHLNEVAPEGARIGVHRVSDLAKPFARPDLIVRAILDEASLQSDPADFVVVCPRSNFDDTFLADGEEVWRVTRAGAELTAIRKPDR